MSGGLRGLPPALSFSLGLSHSVIFFPTQSTVNTESRGDGLYIGIPDMALLHQGNKDTVEPHSPSHMPLLASSSKYAQQTSSGPLPTTRIYPNPIRICIFSLWGLVCISKSEKYYVESQTSLAKGERFIPALASLHYLFYELIPSKNNSEL